MSELDHEVAHLSQSVKMGKYVLCIQQQPVREPRGHELEGQKSVAPPPRRFHFQYQTGRSEFGWKGLFVCFYLGCAFQGWHHSLTGPPLIITKPRAIPKFTWNSSKFATHMESLPWCQSCHQCPALYPSSFLHADGRLAGPSYVNFPHALTQWNPACLCSGMPNYWAIEAHDLWGFLQPYVTKTKAVVPWNQKGWRNFEEWCTFKLFWLWWGFVGICIKQLIKIYTFTMSIIPL